MEPHLRAADTDRERTVAELSEHTAAGRLTLDEFDERARAAYAARTIGDLAALTADLPRAAPARNGTASTAWWALAAAVLTIVLLGSLMVVTGSALADGMPGMTGMMHTCH